MTSLLLPPDWGLHPDLLPWWTGGAFLQRMLKGDSMGVNPAPNRDPALSAKVTTGGLSVPQLHIEGKVPPPMD
jgi:hypothetical protein